MLLVASHNVIAHVRRQGSIAQVLVRFHSQSLLVTSAHNAAALPCKHRRFNSLTHSPIIATLDFHCARALNTQNRDPRVGGKDLLSLHSHKNTINRCEWNLLNDGRWFASAGRDQLVKIWSVSKRFNLARQTNALLLFQLNQFVRHSTDC